MAQVTAQDIIGRLNAHAEALGDDIIGLAEDINDSVVAPVDMSQYVEKSAYEDLKRKYVERFEQGDGVQKVETKPTEDTPKRITYEDLFCE